MGVGRAVLPSAARRAHLSARRVQETFTDHSVTAHVRGGPPRTAREPRALPRIQYAMLSAMNLHLLVASWQKADSVAPSDSRIFAKSSRILS